MMDEVLLHTFNKCKHSKRSYNDKLVDLNCEISMFLANLEMGQHSRALWSTRAFGFTLQQFLLNAGPIDNFPLPERIMLLYILKSLTNLFELN